MRQAWIEENDAALDAEIRMQGEDNTLFAATFDAEMRMQEAATAFDEEIDAETDKY